MAHRSPRRFPLGSSHHRQRTRREQTLQAARIPGARVKPVDEIPDDPHVAARGLWKRLHYTHNDLTFPVQQSPWIFRSGRLPETHQAPYRGADTRYVLSLVGRDDEMDDLIARGVVGPPEGPPHE